MISKAEIRRMIQAGKTAAYNEANKAEYKRLSLKLMRSTAKLLGCYGPGIVRFNAGGIAVSGDAILHSDRVYINLSFGCCQSLGVMVRAVESRKDYHGKANHWYPLEKLAEYGAVGLAEFASKVAEYHASLDYAIQGHCKACTRPVMRAHLDGRPSPITPDGKPNYKDYTSRSLESQGIDLGLKLAGE